jgi:hypothetical protein
VWKGEAMKDWTPDEWTNLCVLNRRLAALLAEPQPENRAWRVRLRITLNSLADYAKTAGREL